MKLYIDTSDNSKTKIILGNKEFTQTHNSPRDQRVLAFILECLDQENISFHDLTKIGVHTGPGSYTGLRVGATIGQTLAYMLNVPVNESSPISAPLMLTYEKKDS